jgi:glycerol-3-phosphate dehydrogenase
VAASDCVDLLIVGGGINGAGIARDAAGRGLQVALVEQADLASATSSASTKLIHGGLRYLEFFEFRLVRESLIERERLLRIAPHLVRPMQFILPHVPGLRPRWQIPLRSVLLRLLQRTPDAAAFAQRASRHGAYGALRPGWITPSRTRIAGSMTAVSSCSMRWMPRNAARRSTRARVSFRQAVDNGCLACAVRATGQRRIAGDSRPRDRQCAGALGRAGPELVSRS